MAADAARHRAEAVSASSSSSSSGAGSEGAATALALAQGFSPAAAADLGGAAASGWGGCGQLSSSSVSATSQGGSAVANSYADAIAACGGAVVAKAAAFGYLFGSSLAVDLETLTQVGRRAAGAGPGEKSLPHWKTHSLAVPKTFWQGIAMTFAQDGTRTAAAQAIAWSLGTGGPYAQTFASSLAAAFGGSTRICARRWPRPGRLPNIFLTVAPRWRRPPPPRQRWRGAPNERGQPSPPAAQPSLPH